MGQLGTATNARILLCAAFVLSGCQSLDNAVGLNNPKQQPVAVAPENDGREPAIVTAPQNPTADSAMMKARSLESQGKYDEALAEFERAISVNPRMTTAYLGAGDIYRQKGDYESAEQRYGKAAEIEPQNFDAQYLHGLSLQLLSRIGDSVRAYLRALTIRPDDFNANLNLATAYVQLGEPAQALPYARRAVELKPKEAAARINLAAAYRDLNQHDAAIIELQQASELTELSAPLLLNLADSLGKVGKYEEMVNTLDQLVKTEPTAIANERLGFAQFKLRRYSESLASFRRALEIDPNHYPALNGVGVCLINEWHFSGQANNAAREEAVQAWRRSLQLERNQPQIMEFIGRFQ
jgi:tetratricopeptide (TPR) repeat protein